MRPSSLGPTARKTNYYRDITGSCRGFGQDRPSKHGILSKGVCASWNSWPMGRVALPQLLQSEPAVGPGLWPAANASSVTPRYLCTWWRQPSTWQPSKTYPVGFSLCNWALDLPVAGRDQRKTHFELYSHSGYVRSRSSYAFTTHCPCRDEQTHTDLHCPVEVELPWGSWQGWSKGLWIWPEAWGTKGSHQPGQNLGLRPLARRTMDRTAGWAQW